MLIDYYQTDEARYVDTSSGGEKFLISLALALGLSDLASNNVSIDSLFIDEGFGTLDSQTLETVISSLETLQAQGKMIGIISHVENLKERIPAQIKVLKKSNGVSEVELVKQLIICPQRQNRTNSYAYYTDISWRKQRVSLTCLAP